MCRREDEPEERYKVSETADQVRSPYSSEQISEEHVMVVLAIRQRVRRWLALQAECRSADESLREEYLQATVALASGSLHFFFEFMNQRLAGTHLSNLFAGSDIPSSYAFVQLTPSGKPKQLPVFRSAFASKIKTYWIAFLQTMTEVQRGRVIKYIDDYPSSTRVPRLNGTRLVYNVQDLKLVELESIMRGLALVIAAGFSQPAITLSWRELSEAGVWLWEE